MDQGDLLALPDIRIRLEQGQPIVLLNKTKNGEIPLHCEISDRQREILLAGGLLNYTREQG